MARPAACLAALPTPRWKGKLQAGLPTPSSLQAGRHTKQLSPRGRNVPRHSSGLVTRDAILFSVAKKSLFLTEGPFNLLLLNSGEWKWAGISSIQVREKPRQICLHTHIHTHRIFFFYIIVSFNKSQRCNYLGKIDLPTPPPSGSLAPFSFVKCFPPPYSLTLPPRPLSPNSGVRRGQERPRSLKSYLRAGNVLKGHLINPFLSPRKYLSLRELKGLA